MLVRDKRCSASFGKRTVLDLWCDVRCMIGHLRTSTRQLVLIKIILDETLARQRANLERSKSTPGASIARESGLPPAGRPFFGDPDYTVMCVFNVLSTLHRSFDSWASCLHPIAVLIDRRRYTSFTTTRNRGKMHRKYCYESA